MPLAAKKAAVAPKKVLAGKVKPTTTTKKTTAPSRQGAAKKVRDVIEIDGIDCLMLNGQAMTGSKSAAKTKPAATKKSAVKSAKKVSVIVRNDESLLTS